MNVGSRTIIFGTGIDVGQFVRFVLVGVLNTIFGFSLYSLFIYLNMHYSMAVLLGTILGVIFNFKTVGKLVFRVNQNRLIFRFFGVYGVTYLINVAALSVFNRFHVDLYLAGAILIVPMALISFLLNKRFVFKENFLNASD
jgi:putative flippase GtrA